jgi:hypothetical protein
LSLNQHLLLSGIALLLFAVGAPAQPVVGVTAAIASGPTAGQVVAWQDQRWWLPLSSDLVLGSTRLQRALQQHCAGGPVFPARQAWREVVDRWDRVSVLNIGPLLARESAQRIDTQPVDPAEVAKGITAAGQGAPDLSALAPSGRGLAALEWLLWSPPLAKRGPRLPSRSYEPAACRLAVALAAQVQDEAQALSEAFRARAAAPLDAEAAMLRLRAVTTQWAAGLEALRDQRIEAPLAEAQALKLKFARLPRGLSGGAPADRLARWTGLRGLLVQDGVLLPQTAANRTLSVASWVKGLGRLVLARQLEDGVQQVDDAVRASIGNNPAALHQLSERWLALATLVRDQVMPIIELPLTPAQGPEAAADVAADAAAEAASGSASDRASGAGLSEAVPSVAPASAAAPAPPPSAASAASGS